MESRVAGCSSLALRRARHEAQGPALLSTRSPRLGVKHSSLSCAHTRPATTRIFVEVCTRPNLVMCRIYIAIGDKEGRNLIDCAFEGTKEHPVKQWSQLIGEPCEGLKDLRGKTSERKGRRGLNKQRTFLGRCFVFFFVDRTPLPTNLDYGSSTPAYFAVCTLLEGEEARIYWRLPRKCALRTNMESLILSPISVAVLSRAGLMLW